MRQSGGISILLVFLFLFSTLESVFAQERKRIELIRANDLQFDETKGIDAQRLIGNVQFRHEGVLMYCDSAYLFENSNRMEAYGNVRLNQGDSLKLFGDRMVYYGNKRYAEVRENIRMVDDDMTLTTEFLDYDLAAGIGLYYNGGKIVSRVNKNTLTSARGYYYANEDLLYFRDSVILNNPEYDIYTDTLKYQTITEIAYFLGPTTIISDDNTIYCENGWYNTKSNIAQFRKNTRVTRQDYVLKGDSLYYDRNMGYGEAFENVEIQDTISNYLLTGNYGRYNELRNSSYVTGRAQMIQVNEEDSLFLHADTLRAFEDTLIGSKILAYNNVRFYRKDLQGVCDSLSYTETDSLLKMFGQPLIWSEENQISGDSINFKLFDGRITKLYIIQSALIISKEDSTKFNQIKGKVMTGHFNEDNEFYRLDVKGNGQSIYYVTDEKEDGKEYLGVNKAECSDITIYISENEISRIAFLTKPSATYFPMDLFPEDQRLLKGFKWEEEYRPVSREDIFRIIDRNEPGKNLE